MRWILVVLILISLNGFSQSLWKDYLLNANGDTLNRIDQKGPETGSLGTSL